MKQLKLMIMIPALAALLAAPLYAGGAPELRSDEQIKREIVEQLNWDDRVDAAEIKVEWGKRAEVRCSSGRPASPASWAQPCCARGVLRTLRP